MSCEFTCMTCSAEVPDLGPLKTPYRCDKCIAEDRRLCGCWDEDARHRAFSLAAALPMPERSAFTDNCGWIRHYCEKHWAVERAHGGVNA